MVTLGKTIKELRQRSGRTQEALASELGVTAQAVSRWEKEICCPDIELIPSIANFFGVSIDELFGYDNHRSKRIDALYEQICEQNRQNNGVDIDLDDCIASARAALIEFPGNAKLSLALASVLFNTGYVRRGELHTVGADGYGRYDIQRHKSYPEWQEAIKLYERVLPELSEGPMRQQAVMELSQLYKNTGEHKKALQLAEAAPELSASRPLLRIRAFDGAEAAAECGKALLETVRCSAELIERIVLSDQNLPPRIAALLVGNAAGLFGLVCTDGFYGPLAGFVACLHMLRSYYLWLAGGQDEAFEALDEALENAKALDRLSVDHYSAPLLRHVAIPAGKKEAPFAPEMPELWPWWDVPDRESVKSQMQADPRWDEWVRGTR